MESLIISDTSVLLNVLATDCAEEIFTESGWKFSVCKSVVKEAIVLRNRETQETRSLDLAPLLQNGTLHMLALETDSEFELLTDFTAVIGRGGDTESMCFALAVSRSLPIAIDDERAIKRACRISPNITTFSTPDILMQWQDRKSGPSARLKILLNRIQTWSNYFLGPNHPCHEWWNTILVEDIR